jgi:hypothetical protein
VSSFASEPIRVTVTRIQGDQLVNVAAEVIEVIDRNAFCRAERNAAGCCQIEKVMRPMMWLIVTAKSVSWRVAIATVCNPSFRHPGNLRLFGQNSPCHLMAVVHGKHKLLQSVTCIAGDAPLSLLHALMTQPGGQPPPSPHRPP